MLLTSGVSLRSDFVSIVIFKDDTEEKWGFRIAECGQLLDVSIRLLSLICDSLLIMEIEVIQRVKTHLKQRDPALF
jgi:hypothetical protein